MRKLNEVADGLRFIPETVNDVKYNIYVQPDNKRIFYRKIWIDCEGSDVTITESIGKAFTEEEIQERIESFVNPPVVEVSDREDFGLIGIKTASSKNKFIGE